LLNTAFLFLMLPAGRVGMHKKMGGDSAGTSDPSWPKEYSIPYNVLNNKNQGRCLQLFPSNCYAWWSPAFLGVAEHLPPDGKWWMNASFCFACERSFAFPIKLSLSQPTSFFTVTLPPLSHSTVRGVREHLCGAELHAGLNPLKIIMVWHPD